MFPAMTVMDSSAETVSPQYTFSPILALVMVSTRQIETELRQLEDIAYIYKDNVPY